MSEVKAQISLDTTRAMESLSVFKKEVGEVIQQIRQLEIDASIAKQLRVSVARNTRMVNKLKTIINPLPEENSLRQFIQEVINDEDE